MCERESAYFLPLPHLPGKATVSFLTYRREKQEEEERERKRETGVYDSRKTQKWGVIAGTKLMRKWLQMKTGRQSSYLKLYTDTMQKMFLRLWKL